MPNRRLKYIHRFVMIYDIDELQRATRAPLLGSSSTKPSEAKRIRASPKRRAGDLVLPAQAFFFQRRTRIDFKRDDRVPKCPVNALSTG